MYVRPAARSQGWPESSCWRLEATGRSTGLSGRASRHRSQAGRTPCASTAVPVRRGRALQRQPLRLLLGREGAAVAEPGLAPPARRPGRAAQTMGIWRGSRPQANAAVSAGPGLRPVPASSAICTLAGNTAASRAMLADERPAGPAHQAEGADQLGQAAHVDQIGVVLLGDGSRHDGREGLRVHHVHDPAGGEHGGQDLGGTQAQSAHRADCTVPTSEEDVVVTLIGSLAAALTTACWLPQVIKLFRLGDADEFGWPYLVMLLTGLSAWIVYGAYRHDVPIWLCNIVTLLLVVVRGRGKVRGGTVAGPAERTVTMRRRLTPVSGRAEAWRDPGDDHRRRQLPVGPRTDGRPLRHAGPGRHAPGARGHQPRPAAQNGGPGPQGERGAGDPGHHHGHHRPAGGPRRRRLRHRVHLDRRLRLHGGRPRRAGQVRHHPDGG